MAHVKLIKDKYEIPLVIKGIATAEDAAIALDHGVDWIYVSNHGGPSLIMAWLDAGAPEIVAAVAAAPRSWSTARLPRYRYRESDRVRRRSRRHRPPAMLGACRRRRSRGPADAGTARRRSGPVPRPAGVRNFAELDKAHLHAATPTNLPDVFSAFPLLEIEPFAIDGGAGRNRGVMTGRQAGRRIFVATVRY